MSFKKFVSHWTLLFSITPLVFAQVVPPPSGQPEFVNVPIYRSGWDLQRDRDRLGSAIFGSQAGKPSRRGDLLRWHKVGVRKMRYSEYVKMREQEAWLSHRYHLRRKRALNQAQANSFRNKSGEWAIGTIKKIGNTRFYPTGEELAGSTVQTADDTVELFKGLTRVAGGGSWNDPYYGKHVRLDANGNIIEIRPLTPLEAFEDGIATGNPYTFLHGLAEASPTRDWMTALFERQRSNGYTGSFEDFKRNCMITGIVCGAVVGGLKMASSVGGAASGGGPGPIRRMKNWIASKFSKKTKPSNYNPFPIPTEVPDVGDYNKITFTNPKVIDELKKSAQTNMYGEKFTKTGAVLDSDGRILTIIITDPQTGQRKFIRTGVFQFVPGMTDDELLKILDESDGFWVGFQLPMNKRAMRSGLPSSDTRPGRPILQMNPTLRKRFIEMKIIDIMDDDGLGATLRGAVEKLLYDLEFELYTPGGALAGPKGGGLLKGILLAGPAAGVCGTASTPGEGGSCDSSSSGSVKPRIK